MLALNKVPESLCWGWAAHDALTQRSHSDRLKSYWYTSLQSRMLILYRNFGCCDQERAKSVHQQSCSLEMVPINCSNSLPTQSYESGQQVVVWLLIDQGGPGYKWHCCWVD